MRSACRSLQGLFLDRKSLHVSHMQCTPPPSKPLWPPPHPTPKNRRTNGWRSVWLHAACVARSTLLHHGEVTQKILCVTIITPPGAERHCSRTEDSFSHELLGSGSRIDIKLGWLKIDEGCKNCEAALLPPCPHKAPVPLWHDRLNQLHLKLHKVTTGQNSAPNFTVWLLISVLTSSNSVQHLIICGSRIVPASGQPQPTQEHEEEVGGRGGCCC